MARKHIGLLVLMSLAYAIRPCLSPATAVTFAAQDWKPIGTSAEIERLRQLLRASDSKDSIFAAKALAALGRSASEAAPELLHLMIQSAIASSDDSDEATNTAENALLAVARPSFVIPGLAKLRELGEDQPIKWRLLAVIQKIYRPGDDKTDAELRSLIKSDNDPVRRLVILTFAIPLADTSLIGPLTLLLDKGSDDDRCAAAYALASYGTRASTSIPSLDRAIRDRSGSQSLKLNSIIALGAVGARSPNAAVRLAHLMTDRKNNTEVRIAAVAGLGCSEYRAKAKRTLLDIARMGEHDARGKASLAKAALSVVSSLRLEKEDVAPLRDIFQQATHGDGPLLEASLSALCALGPHAKEVIPAVLLSIRDHDCRVEFCVSEYCAFLCGACETARVRSMLNHLLGELDPADYVTKSRIATMLRRVDALKK